MLFVSPDINSTIPAGMDISTDFSQPNACDIIIGKAADSGLGDAWNWKFSDHIRLGHNIHQSAKRLF
jgi:hypothetical protein